MDVLELCVSVSGGNLPLSRISGEKTQGLSQFLVDKLAGFSTHQGGGLVYILSTYKLFFILSNIVFLVHPNCRVTGYLLSLFHLDLHISVGSVPGKGITCNYIIDVL